MTDFDVQKSQVLLFDPADLKIVTNPREMYFDERALLETSDSLVKNIMTNGVIQPVVIAKDGSQAVVVAGRQRVKAAREANQRLSEMGAEPLKVPCVLRRGDNAEMYGIVIAENEQRRDDIPMDKARKLNRYLNYGGTIELAAEVFGVSLNTIKNWMALLDLTDEAKEAVKSGDISSSAAKELSHLPNQEQEKAIKKIKRSGVKSATKVKDILDNKPIRKRRRTRQYAEIEDKLSIDGLSEQIIHVLEWVLKLRDDF